MKLFEPLTMGPLTLPNRIVMAPMTRSRANDDGLQPDIAREYYGQRSGAGLIISEATNVSPMAKGYVRTPGIFTAAQVNSWTRVVDEVHARDGRIFLQLFHTGRIALPDFLPDNQVPVAPSAVAANGENYTDSGMKHFVMPRALETDEIAGVVRDFRQAAENGFEAGFDGIEIHGASGYLVQQFLSATTNLRSDQYGGSVENRARFLMEIMDALSSINGAERIGLKLSPRIPFNDVHEEDAEAIYPYIVEQATKRGLVYTHVMDARGEGWHDRLKAVAHLPYFAGGGFTRESGEALLAAGGADAIVFGAKYLANPDLPRRFQQNASLNTPDTATFYAGGEKGYIDYPALADPT